MRSNESPVLQWAKHPCWVTEQPSPVPPASHPHTQYQSSLCDYCSAIIWIFPSSTSHTKTFVEWRCRERDRAMVSSLTWFREYCPLQLSHCSTSLFTALCAHQCFTKTAHLCPYPHCRKVRAIHLYRAYFSALHTEQAHSKQPQLSSFLLQKIPERRRVDRCK